MKLNNMSMKLNKVISKVSGNKLLLTMRDTFIMAAMPLMIAGFAIMINSVFLDPNGIIFGENGLHIGLLMYGGAEQWLNSNFALTLMNIQSYVNLFSQGTMVINSLLIIVGFSFFFTKRFFPKNREPIISSFYALASFFICLPWQFETTVNDSSVIVNGLNSDYLGPKGIFAGLVISFVTVYVYNKLLEKNIKIKMPDTVPPAVARSFESLVPGFVAISIFVIVAGFSNSVFKCSFPELILNALQTPAMAIAKTPFFALAAIIGQPFLQWFGIHGSSVWGPIFGVTWDIASTENVLGTAQNLYSTLFMNFSVVASGTLTLAPLIALALFSKRDESKSLIKIASMPALFNISEPITFGLPIALNPIYFIPYVGSWVVSFFTAQVLTIIGFIPIVSNNVPWTVPPILSGILYTGTWTGAVAQIIILALSVLLWMPFVKIANNTNNGDK